MKNYPISFRDMTDYRSKFVASSASHILTSYTCQGLRKEGGGSLDARMSRLMHRAGHLNGYNMKLKSTIRMTCTEGDEVRVCFSILTEYLSPTCNDDVNS